MKSSAALLLLVPFGVVTTMSTLPPCVVVGLVAWMLASFRTWNVAERPPNVTAVAPVKSLPMIETTAPASPVAGTTSVMTGAVWARAGAGESAAAARTAPRRSRVRQRIDRIAFPPARRRMIALSHASGSRVVPQRPRAATGDTTGRIVRPGGARYGAIMPCDVPR